jgi:hypothetical protein
VWASPRAAADPRGAHPPAPSGVRPSPPGAAEGVLRRRLRQARGAARAALQRQSRAGTRCWSSASSSRCSSWSRRRVKEDGIRYEYLDGSTKDRAERVERFQGDPSVGVFLISLKAGGTGLNLTAADTVIHFDPWWNPAVEQQASDRAHRIGQSKVVTVYRWSPPGPSRRRSSAQAEEARARRERALRGRGGTKKLTKQDLEDLFSIE